MLKKMNNMNIKGRLNYVFRLIIIAFSVVAVVISAMMIYMSMDYRRVLKRYASLREILLQLCLSSRDKRSFKGSCRI